MAFDKKTYWQRRGDRRVTVVSQALRAVYEQGGKRGQDPVITEGKIILEPKNMESRVDKKLGLVPFPHRDRRYSKFGQRLKDGLRPFTKTGVNHTVSTPNEKNVLPRTDPNLSNHARMLMRKQYRGDGLPKGLAQ